MKVIITLTLLALALAKVPDNYGKYWTETGSFEISGLVTGGPNKVLITHPHFTDDKDFPLVVFAHGMTGGGWKLYPGYFELLKVIASHGYVVVSPEICPDVWCPDYPLDIKHTLQTVYANSSLHDALKLVDKSRVGLVGHSMGGNAVVRVSTMKEVADNFPVKGVVAFNPAIQYDNQTISSQIKFPLFFITGTKDTTVTPQSVIQAFEDDKEHDKMLANVVGDEHGDCTIRGHDHMIGYAALYLDCKIKGDTKACGYFYDMSNPDRMCKNGVYSYEQCYVSANM